MPVRWDCPQKTLVITKLGTFYWLAKSMCFSIKSWLSNTNRRHKTGNALRKGPYLSQIRFVILHSLTTLTLAPHCISAFPINHCTNHTTVPNHSLHWLHSWIPSDTLYKPWTSSLSSPSIVLLRPISLSGFPVWVSCWLPGLFILIWPFAACLLDILSVCRLPRPLHCPCLCISLAFVNLVTVDWTLPVWPPLV